MGLDMYLTGHKYFWDPERRQQDGFRVKSIQLELGYWRKHPNLHGFIIKTFADGVDKCQDIELEAEDIEKIIMAIENNELPETTGFFFGTSDGSEKEEDLEIFHKALVWLKGQPAGGVPKLGTPTDLGGGLAMIKLEVPDQVTSEKRSVVYRASW